MIILASFSFKTDRRRLTSLIKRVEALDGTTVEVGFFPEDRYGSENGNLPVAQVAAYNEFGTTRNPTRPFMAPTFEEFTSQFHYARLMKSTFENVLRDGRQTNTLLKKLGKMVAEQMQVNIDDYPGSNSPAWAAYKGFNDPLFHTGKMLESVKFQIHRRQ
ncbi:hypothetical protein QE321_gp160 [Pseudomonas phage SPA01]|uniref:Uncharacterized protein n=4 Tax=Viruses TaxID=10239 RepID=A0AAF0G3A7_9CAUD|nr:hypothetical protein QE321_gp160 [Pseudomonas phage SPA01]YP_010762293.1 hypothetical protein QE323_gp009 [Pseudomonas phage SPA05]KEH08726.1 hypothetical protein GY14_17665 [Delftia tsuruhatensis]KEH12927.1 hypothetical protein GY15_16165 [Delftia sp. 670]WFP45943.1 hypothetical protein VIPPAEUMC01_00008 [Pseudomonas phage vB_VIPPAEUMC01]WJJ54460.1 tail protein [Pseudomonas phage PT07]WQZ01335.1 putative RNA polymerase [Pseudomonas phage Pae01]